MAIASIVFDPFDGSEALVSASTADSKAVVADSKAVSAGDDASTADSKAVVADSIADEALDNASTADSKADSAGTVADSAIGSEPGVGEYRVTDIERDADGSLVVEYDDSQIT
ncbi:MAG: hypothetical protein R6U15_07630 [Candidatus Izemoplasmatales bacterium]